MIGLSVDSQERSAKLATRLGLTLPLLSDPARSVVRAYGVEDSEDEIAWPAIFLVGREGKIAWRSLSADYRLRASAEEVLRAIERIDR